jgi:2-aminoadipate transaminase
MYASIIQTFRFCLVWRSLGCYTTLMTTIPPISQIKIPPGMIDLGQGDPPFSLLPLELLRQSAERCFAENDPSFLQYGAEQGDGRLRLALADFLSQGYGFPVAIETLFISNGISGALDLLCTLFARAGETVFVEEPSYFLALRIFADHNLQVVSIATDEQGLLIEDLRDKLGSFQPRFLYLIPTFQNPTGSTLSDERRRQVVELSRERGFLVLADEVYHFLSYSGKPPRPFAAHTAAESVISLGSFSKILAPGLRLGWIQAHPAIISRLAGCGLLDSGGGLNPFASAMVRGVLETGGLEQNIARLTEIYRSSANVMAEALSHHLPGATYSLPEGGYFFWVKLPGGIDSLELRGRARGARVDFRPGALFSSRGGLHDFLRLCFIYYGPDEIEEGLRRLGECARRPVGLRS